jgi:hypothetical protein
MNLKAFLTVSFSVVLLAFPYNIIGCAGGDADPYDYFVSFFHHDLSEEQGYKQFYYTNYEFLYDTKENQDVATLTAGEWTGYGNKTFDSKAAYDFVCKFAWKDLNNLYFNLEKNQPLKIPDSVKRNGMTNFFMTSKDLEALGYIMYAKQAEPHVTGDWSSWEPIQRDKVKMEKLMKSGQQLYKAAKKDFIKLRYAYQLLRLAHYSGRYTDCKKWYDEMVATNNTASILQDLSLSLKAGAMMRLGDKTKAAYIFSKLFSKNEFRRVNNYMSFDWCVNRFEESSRKACLNECKTSEEKANMLGLFLLGSNSANELKALQQVYDLNPNAALLEILTTREMNKLEEYYFTRNLRKGERGFYSYDDEQAKKVYEEASAEIKDLIVFCNKAAAGKATRNKGLYKLSAAHAAFMMQDYPQTRRLLDEAKGMTNTEKLKDQWQLTTLLVNINEKDKIDAAFEKSLVTSCKWLEERARADNEYAKFYRRLFADVLAPRYKAQQEEHKYVLALGTADYINGKMIKDAWGNYGYGYGNSAAINTLRSELTATQVESLVTLMEGGKANEFEKWMIGNCSFNKDDVNDVAGTAWLRQENWENAISWFKKIPAAYYNSETYKTWMAANPFADLMLDVHTKTKFDTKKYTKLSFAEKMKELQAMMTSKVNNEAVAKATYDYATGLYNMSYWGNSWMLVNYGWSTYEPHMDSLQKANDFEKWYFTASNAEASFNKAMETTQNKELKARCLYMAAKCAQKNTGTLPARWEDDYKTKMNGWLRSFGKNYPYYNKLKKEYGQTAFYKEAYNTCSYLRDFVSLRP